MPAFVADLATQRDRRVVQHRADRLGETGRRGLLDDLCLAAGRAVPLEEVQHVPVVVGQHLHLDVPSSFDEPLDQYRAVTERRLGLARVAASMAAGRSAADATTRIPCRRRPRRP